MRRWLVGISMALVVAGCATPTPVPSPSTFPSRSLVPASPAASPSPTIILTCPAGPILPGASPMTESTCADDEAIVVSGAAFLGYPIHTISISGGH